jgi:thiol:disulfide interchange protein DsbD
MAMMLRILILSLAVSGLVARASDPINAPVAGASVTVTQPHVTAQLIPERTLIVAGKPFDVILHLHSDPEWHTYWINPGDAGLATEIKWTLPPGFKAGPIQWPTPEKHNMGPLVTYGYGGDVYLLTTITAAKPTSSGDTQVKITARASWLVCMEECIPGKADLSVSLEDYGKDAPTHQVFESNDELFSQARARLPVANTRWDVSAVYLSGKGSSEPPPSQIAIDFTDRTNTTWDTWGNIQGLVFFPEQANVLATQNQKGRPLYAEGQKKLVVFIDLQQNGERPDKMSGVLVADTPLIGNAKAVYISEFPVLPNPPPSQDGLQLLPDSSSPSVSPQMGTAVPSGTAPAQGPAPATSSGNTATGTANTLKPAAGTAAATSAGGNSAQGADAMGGNSSDGHRPPLHENGPAAQPLLVAVLGAAFVGGLILNLMPCVLPVLSLKVFSLMKHAGENPKAAWVQGAAFTAGVVLSFWGLAGLLLALRSAGNHLGWGFQMQSPGFVLALIFLFFLLGLNLFGVFELGSSLVGLDAKATGNLGGLASSFGNGALATVAATPCTAPFMGSALGFAAQQPGYISMLIFTFLALGMASPYMLLTIFPGALKFVPKPGAWMEAFKQLMGFLLMATVIFLIYVFGALTSGEQVPWLLFVLLLAGIGAWIYGKWGTPASSGTVRAVAFILAIGFLGYAIFWGVALANAAPPPGTAAATTEADGGHRPPLQTEGEWQPWSQSAVDAALAKGQPVFVDFTAAWCLSCKVNERVALGTDAVKKAFADKNVALFKADWTHSDPEISKTLQKFNRDGVPLYLLYSPKNPGSPQVLPEVLTPGIVLDAVGKLGGSGK